ncbi:hypothetical protein J7E78_01545 [Paenibacillus polymyxa]|uniref:hypothetical protein n=1 Tax=Paenibacillus polymyxa TaxID=1406 RepID=UPI001BE50DDB|nr:hypothetical protein [Paenibacillus polymyxa]MBT2282236.1 hypothetical protein [Paenibacillus polymyxa]
MKKFNLKVLALGTVMLFSLSSSIHAWSYSNYNNGSYVPKSGQGFLSLVSSGGNTRLNTSIYFTLDSTNVTNILDYNNGGDNPGNTCDNANAYLTIDQTAIPDSWDLEIDGDEVRTNLPNPKIDIEDNNFFGEDDETEVTVLGTVESGKTYYMESLWNDYRDGGSGDSGKVNAQFAISKKGASDYNNCVQSSVVQHVHTYGDNLGGFSLPGEPTLLEEFPSEQSLATDLQSYESGYPDLISEHKAVESGQISISSYREVKRVLLDSIVNPQSLLKDAGDSEKIAVTITFEKPITLSELEGFTKKHNVEVEQVQARAIDQNNDRITMATDSIKVITLDDSNVTFSGYTDLKGYVSKDQISNLTEDTTAYIIDPSGDKSITGQEEDIFAQPLTWLIEDTAKK